MKIAFVVWNLGGGGAERVYVNLMNHLSGRHEVYALIAKDTPPSVKYEPSEKVRVIRLQDSRGPKALVYLKMIRQIRALKKRLGIEVSLGFLEWGNFANVLSRAGERCIISVRNMISLKMKYRWKHDPFLSLAKLTDRFCDVMVCVSSDVARDQVSHYHIPRRKIRVIRNYCDAELIRSLASEPPEDPEFGTYRAAHPFCFIATGRLDVQKGYGHLFKSFLKLLETVPDAGLVILGSGPIEAEIRAEADRLGLSGHIFMPGRKSNPFAYMACCDAFVLTSLYEGFPNAVLEAMACGLPVIADDCAGIREALDPERPYGERILHATHAAYGIITPVFSPEDRGSRMLSFEEKEFCAAMAEIAGEPALRKHYARAGLKRLKAFTPVRILSEWETLIENRRS